MADDVVAIWLDSLRCVGGGFEGVGRLPGGKDVCDARDDGLEGDPLSTLDRLPLTVKRLFVVERMCVLLFR